jgi:DMSO reductase anchor subunit
MNPAFSVVFLTTLIGVGQGLLLALYVAEVGGLAPNASPGFYVWGAVLAIVFAAGGLIASFAHLGRPERAWRAATMWRTSWLSREVIVLPAFMASVAAYGFAHYAGLGSTRGIGAVAVLLCIALFVCTGMIYACIRFLQEWASPLTLVNYAVLGSASGFTLAAAYAASTAPEAVPAYVRIAIALTLLGLVTRSLALLRNARLKPKSTLQSATGIANPKVRQLSQGFMGGSFNTREFFHGRPAGFLRSVKWMFLLLAFVVPVLLLMVAGGHPAALLLAFVVQYVGLLAERWFFFAQANHPQNLYYQVVS